MTNTSLNHNVTTGWSVPISVNVPVGVPAQPITVGIPFPRGVLFDPVVLRLLDTANAPIPLQAKPLAWWPDGSIRWLLLDFVARDLRAGHHDWQLAADTKACGISPASCSVTEQNQRFLIDTGTLVCDVSKKSNQPLLQVLRNGRKLLDPSGTQIRLTDTKENIQQPRITRTELESSGPVRTTVFMEASFGGRTPCRLIVRICNYLGTGLVRLRLTIHNPRRARHRGGIWDLGDPGSIFFNDLSIVTGLPFSDQFHTRFTEAVGQPLREVAEESLEIYQDSSGGDNWQSRNHVNRFGKVPCTFRGYRVRTGTEQTTGLRANPVVRLCGTDCAVTVAIPEFWQQFPKGIESHNGILRLRLFPSQFGDPFELQGGEQKTHTVWMDFGAFDQPENTLNWVHQPADVRPTFGWCASSGAFPDLITVQKDSSDRFDDYLAKVIEGPTSLFARREVIDEYGWRNFGDIYADHENAYYTGTKPVVSHYNNQFDPLFGAILQYVRTGDPLWRGLSDPLARHVIDIDIYHTEQDRAAYRGGMFWMTDHYLDAATSTHRTYSLINRRGGQSYGGGPGSSHNFTSGLLYYHYLTGDPLAREAVLSLADWVIRMDDGRLNALRHIDPGPTGLASCTTFTDYHGPGRGAGLSINSQIDAWLLSDKRVYLEKADQLIRRCIHPADNIAALDLLNAELRWSYPVFLVALARFLRCKVETGELDQSYAYGRASLLHYAAWMLENERPFLDRRNDLEFPTETWAAQEFRKANAMRLAAEHADDTMRMNLLRRATELADRAWDDLLSFANPHTTRAVAILLTEGTRDQCFRSDRTSRLPPPALANTDFGSPVVFVSQKQRVRELLKSPWGLLVRAARVALRRG